MYSFHSSPEEKNKLLYALAQHGIETTVDRAAKKKRIRDWIQESVIQEDDEEEDSSSAASSIIMTRAPVAGHVSSVRAAEKAAHKQIVTTVKDAANKHRDPRTGEIQQGPSEMGARAADTQTSNGTHAYKLVDVGSQTSSESQKMNDGPADNSHIHYNESTASQANASSFGQNRLSTNRRQNSAPEPLVTSRGLMAAFNSLATITVPESSHSNAQMQQDMHKSNQVIDSGYGSLDKLKATDNNGILSSPIFGKRSVPNVSYANGHGGQAISAHYSNSNDKRREKDRSPFESDSGGDGSPCGSSRFVNKLNGGNGLVTRSTIITSSMKDTPYDMIKPRRNK